MVRRERKYNYFTAFVSMANYSSKAAELLNKTLTQYNPSVLPDKLKEMHEIEHAADMETHKMQNHLSREFITPIEREDILRMAQKLDDVTDCVEDVLIGMYMYNSQSVPEEAVQMTEIIQKCCRALEAALKEFNNFKKANNTINERIIEINRLEEDCDRLYIEGNRRLYCNCTDPLKLYSWSANFTRLENCCDACEDVADVMERIIMKNS